MDARAFQQFLYSQIPITEKMELEVIEFKPSRVKILARLEPNLNHKNTAFGGSINSLMVVCGWSTVFVNVKDYDAHSHIVIQRSNIEYLAPIKKDFVAECKTDSESIEDLLATYTKFGKARIDLNVVCKDEEKILAKFEGRYVVFR